MESEGTGENRSPREAGVHRITEGFHFLLLFLYFVQFTTLKRYLEMFRYSDIQITSRHKQTQNREGGGEVWASLYPKFLKRGEIYIIQSIHTQ